MLNDISNRERFDILVARFCKAINQSDLVEVIRDGQPFGADGMECRLELNSSIDERRAYIFVCAGFPQDAALTGKLVADITTLAEGQCGLVRPENDSPVYTVVPFSVEATDVKGLNDYFMTALDVAWALQDDSTQAA